KKVVGARPANSNHVPPDSTHWIQPRLVSARCTSNRQQFPTWLSARGRERNMSPPTELMNHLVCHKVRFRNRPAYRKWRAKLWADDVGCEAAHMHTIVRTANRSVQCCASVSTGYTDRPVPHRRPDTLQSFCQNEQVRGNLHRGRIVDACAHGHLGRDELL